MSAAHAHDVHDCGLRHYGAAAATIVCRPSQDRIERALHYAIRHQVFVGEQSLFPASDRDAHDDEAAVIQLIGYCEGVPAGTVRLYELDPAEGLWQGDRLAVLEPYRVRGVGAPLVRCAVATAATHGGRTMIAHIQLQNVGFFRRLGWTASGDVEIYAGQPHQLMNIELPGADEGRRITGLLAEGVSARDR